MWTFIAIAGLGLAGFLLINAYRLVRALDDIPSITERETPGSLGLDYQSVELALAGRAQHAWLVSAEQPANRYVVLAHGWGKDASLMLPWVPVLHAAGFNLLLIDFSGHGASGYRGYSNLSRFTKDLETWVDWLATQQRANPANVTIVAHSMAGAAAIWLAARRQLALVVTINCYAHAAATVRKTMSAIAPVASRFSGRLVLFWLQVMMGRSFNQVAPSRLIRSIRCPLLILHGEQDRFVDPSNAQTLMQQAPTGKARLIRVPRAGHNSMRRLVEHTGAELVAFIRSNSTGKRSQHTS